MLRTTNPRKKQKVKTQDASTSESKSVEVDELYLLENNGRNILIRSIEKGGSPQTKFALKLEHSGNFGNLQLWNNGHKMLKYLITMNNSTVSKMLLKKNNNYSLADIDDRSWHFIHINTKKESDCQYLFQKARKEKYTVIVAMQLKFIDENNSPHQVTLHLSDFNSSLLHRAVAKKDMAVIKTLLKCNSDINVRNKEDMTPLHVAAKMGDADIVKLLLEKGADCGHATHSSRSTPFHLAVRRPNLDIVKVFMNFNTDINAVYGNGETALHIAAEENNYEAVKFILKKKPNINKKTSNGLTALHYAPESKNTSIVELLIKNGADVNLKNDWEETVLHIASREPDTPIEMIKLILNYIDDVDAKDQLEQSALHIAAEEHSIDTLKCLLEKHANVNLKDYRGRTPLHLSANLKDGNSIECTKILVDHGADVNAVSDELTTPLHYACFGGDVEAVEFLIENGADTSMRNKHGRTAFHFTCMSHLDEFFISVDSREEAIWDILNILLEKEEDVSVNCVDKTGKTPLHYCVNKYYHSDNGYILLHKLLLKIGVDVNILDDNKETAFDLVIKKMDLDKYFSLSHPDLLHHIIKMKVLKLWVHEKILDIIYNTDNGEHLEWIQNYERVCSEELNSMKTINIGQSGLTYYDFLKKTQHDVVNFTQNQNIVNALKADGLLDQFPIYGYFLKSYLREG